MEKGELDRPGISRRLREARDVRGYTRDQVADLLSIHVNTLEGWENPRSRTVPFDKLGEIADLYGVKKGWLLNGDELVEDADAIREELRAIRELLERVFREASG